jgi:ribose 5-phosphate isomerase A
MTQSSTQLAKQQVAAAAAKLVFNQGVVGLGTGSTADIFIDLLAQRVKDEDLSIQVVSSSVVSQQRARQAGLQVIGLEQCQKVHLYVDGADEVTADLTLLKGRGQDLVREKILANAAMQFIVLADESKQVNTIGEKFPIPVEVMPFAWQLVLKQLTELGAEGSLRMNANGGAAVTAHGSLVLDMSFPETMSAAEINAVLNAMPGVVEHGIFIDLASAVFIGKPDSIEAHWR